MTPAEIELAARRRYNAVSDTFWSQQEIFNMIYGACLEVADEDYAIERTYSTSTVSGTQEYDFPSNTIAIKRATWDGNRLTKIDMVEDDLITGLNAATTSTGNPQFYWVWNDVISLRPIPGSVATLKLWTYNEPSAIVTSTQEVLIPTQHHMRLISYVLAGMAAKDSNYTAAAYYLEMWKQDKQHIKQSMKRLKRADKLTSVKDETILVENFFGG